MTRRHIATLALLLALAPAARASDPVGIYAVIDRVEREPSTDSPQRIRIWGVFALAKGSGETYAPPLRGFMYFRLVPGKEEVCRKEWNDLAKLAGKRQCVALGARYKPNGTVRPPKTDPTRSPDPYPIGFGLTKVPANNSQAKLLLALIASPKDKGKK
jgi:hypothetical protein